MKEPMLYKDEKYKVNLKRVLIVIIAISVVSIVLLNILNYIFSFNN